MVDRVQEILKDAEQRMQGVIAAARKEFRAIRTGRANPALLERVVVDYYGTPTPINQLANVSAPEPRLLLIQPWDKNVLRELEKAILKSDLGLTPSSDGMVVRIQIPQLTEERRKELARLVRKEAEEKRVAVRNVRRDANEQVKKLEKTEGLSEDEARRLQGEIQELTNRFIGEIDRLLEAKEKEIMEV